MTKKVIFALTWLGWLAVSPAMAQEEAPGWKVECSESACAVTRGLLQAQSERLIATLLISVQADQGMRFGVGLPLGTAIDPGVRLVLGERVVDLRFEVCFPDGCRAVRKVDADEMEALLGADRGDLRFFPFGAENPVSISAPLDGLSTAISDARSRLGQ